jgi:hypothetical protein
MTSIANHALIPRGRRHCVCREERFYALRHDASAGVDGVTSREVEMTEISSETGPLDRRRIKRRRRPVACQGLQQVGGSQHRHGMTRFKRRGADVRQRGDFRVRAQG